MPSSNFFDPDEPVFIVMTGEKRTGRVFTKLSTARSWRTSVLNHPTWYGLKKEDCKVKIMRGKVTWEEVE